MHRKEGDERTDATAPLRNEMSGFYAIRVLGHLDAHWSAWFDGLTLTLEPDGTTCIHGRLADQAALHGVLQKVRDLGLELIAVERNTA